MRHGKKFNHLGRKASFRNLMLSNMSCSLIEHKRINTTLAKAKALRKFLEPLITKSKKDTTHSRRIVFSTLRDKYAVTELFQKISVKIIDRPGGYLRIIKLENRQGDNASMAMIEFVDYNEIYNPNSIKKKKTTRRSRKKSDTVGEDKISENEQSDVQEDAKKGIALENNSTDENKTEIN